MPEVTPSGTWALLKLTDVSQKTYQVDKIKITKRKKENFYSVTFPGNIHSTNEINKLHGVK